jgi:hypothetical protein
MLKRVWIAVLLTLALKLASFAAIRDPFLEVDLKQNPEYRKIYTSKLEQTPFDCGRFVSLPAFEPESSVSVYSYRSEDGVTKYRVTYILAMDNMWQASDGIHFPERAKAVKTRRIDADIPASTALLLKNVWLRILSGSHPTAATTPQEVIPIDTPTFEWWVQRAGASALAVQANWYIKVNPLLKRFADLPGVTLVSYCKADVRARSEIAHQVEAQSKTLMRMKAKTD